MRRSGKACGAPRRGVTERRLGSRAALRSRARAPSLAAWLRPGLHLGPTSSPFRASASPSEKSSCGSPTS